MAEIRIAGRDPFHIIAGACRIPERFYVYHGIAPLYGGGLSA